MVRRRDGGRPRYQTGSEVGEDGRECAAARASRGHGTECPSERSSAHGTRRLRDGVRGPRVLRAVRCSSGTVRASGVRGPAASMRSMPHEPAPPLGLRLLLDDRYRVDARLLVPGARVDAVDTHAASGRRVRVACLPAGGEGEGDCAAARLAAWQAAQRPGCRSVARCRRSTTSPGRCWCWRPRRRGAWSATAPRSRRRRACWPARWPSAGCGRVPSRPATWRSTTPAGSCSRCHRPWPRRSTCEPRPTGSRPRCSRPWPHRPRTAHRRQRAAVAGGCPAAGPCCGPRRSRSRRAAAMVLAGGGLLGGGGGARRGAGRAAADVGAHGAAAGAGGAAGARLHPPSPPLRETSGSRETPRPARPPAIRGQPAAPPAGVRARRPRPAAAARAGAAPRRRRGIAARGWGLGPDSPFGPTAPGRDPG